MKPALVHPELWEKFGAFVAERIGLNFPPDRRGDLERGLRLALREFGFDRSEDCLQWLMSGEPTPGQIEILAGNLTVGETFFFRDRRAFDALENCVLPELIAGRRNSSRRLRLWSAGCCSGEEPFSLAMILRKALPRLDDWKITVLGSDINPRFLEKAARGEFTEWSFRNTPPWFKKRHFRSDGRGTWTLDTDIRSMVTFARINLVQDVYPSWLNSTCAVDVLLCRNVLMYFTPQRAERVLRQLSRCLMPNGWLVLSPSEAMLVPSTCFRPVRVEGAILYQRAATDASEAEAEDTVVAAGSLESGSRIPAENWEGMLLRVRPACGRDVRAVPSAPSVPVPAGSDVLERAAELYEQGAYASVEDLLASLGPPSSRDPRVMGLRARALANLGQLEEALHWCDRVLAADKLDLGAHYLRANVLREQGALAPAAESLRGALYLDPQFVLAHFAMGNLAHGAGRRVEARRHLSNALELARRQPPDGILPESDGMSAGRLVEILSGNLETWEAQPA